MKRYDPDHPAYRGWTGDGCPDLDIPSCFDCPLRECRVVTGDTVAIKNLMELRSPARINDDYLVGPAITIARKVLRVSQGELARRISTPPPALCHIEKGRTVPTDETVRKVAAALGMDARPLLAARRRTVAVLRRHSKMFRYSPYSAATRAAVRAALLAGGPASTIARQYGVAKATVFYWRNTLRREGLLPAA